MPITSRGHRYTGHRLSRMGIGLKEIVSDLPEALRREFDYLANRPMNAILTLTWRCSCRCSSCYVWRRPRPSQPELTREQWLAVGRALLRKGVQTFELFGGDVFLRKDVVVPLCRELAEGGGRVFIPTNSRQLDPATASALVDCVHTFYLSTDALGEAHDRMRGVPGTFDRVDSVLEILQRARGDRRWPLLVCNTTVSRDNVEQLADLAAYAASAGYDEIAFEYVGQFTPDHVARSAIGEYRPSPIYLAGAESMLLRPEQVPTLRRQLARARTLAGMNALGRPFGVQTINTEVLSDAHLVQGTVPQGRCFMEHCEAVIDPYGHVVPCLFFDTFPLGHVLAGALEDGWLTERRREFRRCRREGRLELCRHCIMSVVRNRSGLDVTRQAWRRARMTVGC